PSLGLKRYATVVVAAHDSLHSADADFVCTGTNDEATINAAIAGLPFDQSTAGAGGGRVLLMEGSYNVSGNIQLNQPPDRGGSIEIEGVLGAVIDVMDDFAGSTT